jgi:hypothetical protein
MNEAFDFFKCYPSSLWKRATFKVLSEALHLRRWRCASRLQGPRVRFSLRADFGALFYPLPGLSYVSRLPAFKHTPTWPTRGSCMSAVPMLNTFRRWPDASACQNADGVLNGGLTQRSIYAVSILQYCRMCTTIPEHLLIRIFVPQINTW